MAVISFGCQPQTRYKVLCFLFDGVPAPENTEPCDGSDKASAKDRAKKTRKSTSEARGVSTQHGPFAARMCEGCHDRQTNRLIMPVEELCLNCHVLDMTKLHMHGPLASGGCTVCHDPHGSGNKFLLVAESRDFCLYCHVQKDVIKRKIHQNMADGCSTCHYAHGSDKDYLLRTLPQSSLARDSPIASSEENGTTSLDSTGNTTTNKPRPMTTGVSEQRTGSGT